MSRIVSMRRINPGEEWESLGGRSRIVVPLGAGGREEPSLAPARLHLHSAPAAQQMLTDPKSRESNRSLRNAAFQVSSCWVLGRHGDFNRSTHSISRVWLDPVLKKTGPGSELPAHRQLRPGTGGSDGIFIHLKETRSTEFTSACSSI